MISFDEFKVVAVKSIPRFNKNWLNKEQEIAVRADMGSPVFIVAGPGTGKTTVLTMRALKLVFVDGIRPEHIVATTFTRKAAGELRSRLLSWGFALLQQFLADAHAKGDAERIAALESYDINLVRVGTLDSLAEQMVRDSRPIGAVVPAPAQGLLIRIAVRQGVLFAEGRFRSSNFDSALRWVHGLTQTARVDFGRQAGMCGALFDRFRHDLVNINSLAKLDNGEQLVRAYKDYITYLAENHLSDFASTELSLWDRLRNPDPSAVLDDVKALLVDEFQDTNLLQEEIYYEFCRRTKASLTVVGDDDQSVYRFRGATVEIFATFEARVQAALGAEWKPHRIDLYKNYRSHDVIVDFCTRYVSEDKSFSKARVAGKAALKSAKGSEGQVLPVLGLFRESPSELADAVSEFLHDVFEGDGFRLNAKPGPILIQASEKGAYGDAVLLSHTVRESTSSGRDRLPLFLRQSLRDRGVSVFNPRGRDLVDIEPVRLLLGLMLECVDPSSHVADSITSMSPAVRNAFAGWRQDAYAFIKSDPKPGGLRDFVIGWRERNKNSSWPKEWPLLELAFTLVTWLPYLQREPEGQVYLEAIARTVTEAGQLASYRSTIVTHDKNGHDQRSVKNCIREVFESIALGIVDVDEEIMPYVPRSTFPMMTIHQAKGLEYPLVIVDVASDYKTNHPTQRRMRAPEEGDSVHCVEDILAPFTAVGKSRTNRADVLRAWDDLKRLYFVAFSRAQSCLLLVGQMPVLQGRFPAVQAGCTYDGARLFEFVPVEKWDPKHGSSRVALI